MRIQTFEKRLSACQIEFLVALLHHQEESVFRRQREARDIEDRMIRRRQAVHREHSENGAQSRAEYGELKGNRNECRPAIMRLAADVQRIADHIRVVLHEKSREAAEQSTGEDHRR